MPFPPNIKETALVACKRRCCLCEEHVHIAVECHHIVQEEDGGDNSFDNCIPLCRNCHSYVASYNPRHPVGTQYSENELKKRRNNFYAEMNSARSGGWPPWLDPDIVEITPEELKALFEDGKTDAQVQKQIAPLIGKWMRIEGPLENYSDGSLWLKNHNYPQTVGHVWTHFNGSPWTDILSDLDKGTHLILQGKIAWVMKGIVQLIYCELLNS